MGRVKQALLEVEDFVAGCLGEGRTLNQTIRDAEDDIRHVATQPFTISSSPFAVKDYWIAASGTH